MADENIKWASLGGLKTITPARLRDYGYTTSTGTSAGTPEYPILEYDNFWRSSIASVSNSNLDRLDNLSASDVYYTFLIESGSNVIANSPYDTFYTTYGTASSSAGTTSLASQTSGSDYSIDFDGPSSQIAISGDQTRPIKDGGNLWFQGVQPVAGSEGPSLYTYGMNDVGGISNYSGAATGWGIPIHKYDPLIGTYVLHYRVSCVDILPSFTIATSPSSSGTMLLGTIQHGDMLYCLFLQNNQNESSEVSYLLVKFDMANRISIYTRTLIYSPSSTLGTLKFFAYNMNIFQRNCHMAISPSGDKLSIIAPNAFQNTFKSDGFNTYEMVTAGFIIDLTSPTLEYSNSLSAAKDWTSSGLVYLQAEYNTTYYDICKWEDNETLHMFSAFPRITSRSNISGVGYIQHQLIDVTGVDAVNNTTTDLTSTIMSSSSNITQSDFELKTFCADLNLELGEFVIRAGNYNVSQSPITDPFILNRFDLSSLSLIATNESWTPNLINGAGVPLYTTANRGMVYDYNGYILNPIVSSLSFSLSSANPYVAYIPSQFTSGDAGTVITNGDMVNQANLSITDNLILLNILTSYTHTRFLMGGNGTGAYDTETRRAGGNYLNASTNVQSFDPLTIVAKLDNIPMTNSFLPYIKRLDFVPAPTGGDGSGELADTASFALWYDTTLPVPNPLVVGLLVGGVYAPLSVPTSGSWDTALDDLAVECTKQGNVISNATRLGDEIVYATLSYPKNTGTEQSVIYNVKLDVQGSPQLGSITTSSIDSSLVEDQNSKVLYGVDYTSMSATMSTSFTDITFKQYDTYVTSITNVQQALDSLFKIVQDLEDFEPASALAINVANATRFVSLNLALTANTPVNLNHALGEKYVVATVYSDSTDESQQATIVLVDDDNCTVEVGLTGTYNVVIVK